MSSFQIWLLLQASQKLTWDQKMAEKARNFKKIKLGENLATNELNVFEMQSLMSQVKMGRGSQICDKVHKKIVEYFKNNISQCQIEKVKSHCLQGRTSSTDSEKLEKSLCVRDNAEDLYWMFMVFRSSDDTASFI